MGYVYILTNEAMPDLIKIGYTSRTPEERADELYTTGVPHPFKVIHKHPCDFPDILERRMHKKLHPFRVNTDREFFRYPADDAFQLLQKLQGNQSGNWRKWTSQFLSRFKKIGGSVSESPILKQEEYVER